MDPPGGSGARQAACDSTGSGNSRTAWTSSSNCAAISRQLPQVAPQPVRMVSSGSVRQPAAATSRISRSVTPLQRQTYTAAVRWLGVGFDGGNSRFK